MNLSTLGLPDVRFAKMCGCFQGHMSLGDAFNTLDAARDHNAAQTCETSRSMILLLVPIALWRVLLGFFKYKFLLCEAKSLFLLPVAGLWAPEVTQWADLNWACVIIHLANHIYCKCMDIVQGPRRQLQLEKWFILPWRLLALLLEPRYCSLFQSQLKRWSVWSHSTGQEGILACEAWSHCVSFALSSQCCNSTIECELLSSCLLPLLSHFCSSDLTEKMIYLHSRTSHRSSGRALCRCVPFPTVKFCILLFVTPHDPDLL